MNVCNRCTCDRTRCGMCSATDISCTITEFEYMYWERNSISNKHYDLYTCRSAQEMHDDIIILGRGSNAN